MAKRKYVKENNLVKAINTDSLELQKPLVNEYYDINVHNSNMDKIDKGYKQNKNDISNINYELSKTENTKYTTTNGIKEFSCKDGYVDNVVIEGETLVNLVDFNTSRAYSDGITMRTYFKSADRVSNGTYTLFNNNDKEMFFVTSKISNDEYVGGYTVFPNTPYLLELDSDRQCYGIDFGVTSVGWVDDPSWYTNSNVKAIILEGDHTDKPISYFEGLKSVGQGDKIEVLSYKSANKIDLSQVKWKDGYYIANDFDTTEGLECTNSDYSYSETYIPIKPNTSYVFNYSNWNFCFYDSNKQYIKTQCTPPIMKVEGDDVGTFIKESPSNASYVRFVVKTKYKSKVSMYENSNADKKQISTTLRSLPNGVKDTIEKRGNMYVKVQRCKEIVLDGSENWTLQGTTGSTIQFKSDLFADVDGYNAILITDKERCTKDDVEGVGIKFGGNEKRLFYRLSSNKLASQDVAGLKTYLKTNPVTLIYPLETPIITELPNFNPQTYSDNTTLLINSGVIQAEADFEVTNSMGSEIEVLKCITSNLIDNVVDEEVYYPKLLNGWTDRYSSNPLKISKIGNIVIMEGNLYSGTVTAGTLVFTIPHRFRPKRNMFVTVCSRATKSLLGTFSIGLDGNIVVQDNGFGDASSSSGGIAFSYTYSLI